MTVISFADLPLADESRRWNSAAAEKRELKAVPRAFIAAAGIVDGGRGGLDVSEKDKASLRRHLARYYAKMGDTPPWEK